MKKEFTNLTKLQKELLVKHLDDIHARLNVVIEETSYLTANFKALKMILDDKY